MVGHTILSHNIHADQSTSTVSRLDLGMLGPDILRFCRRGWTALILHALKQQSKLNLPLPYFPGTFRTVSSPSGLTKCNLLYLVTGEGLRRRAVTPRSHVRVQGRYQDTLWRRDARSGQGNKWCNWFEIRPECCNSSLMKCFRKYALLAALRPSFVATCWLTS